MKNMVIVSVLIILCTGCARFGTIQIDERRNEKTGEVTKITTKASGYALFSAKSSLAKWKATQSDKSQGAEVGGLEQQGATNIVGAMSEMRMLLQELNKLKTP